MLACVVTLIVGIVCIVLGISNRKGNISSLHSYHRNRVSEEDRIPFGKKVGLGTMIVGIGIIVFGVFMALTLITQKDVYTYIGNVILIAGLVIGLTIAFRAMKKYNKGIF